jgi:hypothetical protein
LDPADKEAHGRMAMLYKLGVGVMCFSFPVSFHFSRKIATDKRRAKTYLAQNLMFASSCTFFFAYSLWKRGRLEDDYARKYLYFFSNYDLENFELNRHNNI